MQLTWHAVLIEEVQLTTDKEPKLRISLKAPLVVTPPAPAAPKAAALKSRPPKAAAVATPAPTVKGKGA